MTQPCFQNLEKIKKTVMEVLDKTKIEIDRFIKNDVRADEKRKIKVYDDLLAIKLNGYRSWGQLDSYDRPYYEKIMKYIKVIGNDGEGCISKEGKELLNEIWRIAYNHTQEIISAGEFISILLIIYGKFTNIDNTLKNQGILQQENILFY